MSTTLRFKTEEDRERAVRLELEVIQKRNWKPKPCFTSTINADLVVDVKKRLDESGIEYEEVDYGKSSQQVKVGGFRNVVKRLSRWIKARYWNY